MSREKAKKQRKLLPRLSPVLALSLSRGVASGVDYRLDPALASPLERGLPPAPASGFVPEFVRQLAGEFVPDLARELISSSASELAPILASDLGSDLVSDLASELDSGLGRVVTPGVVPPRGEGVGSLSTFELARLPPRGRTPRR